MAQDGEEVTKPTVYAEATNDFRPGQLWIGKHSNSFLVLGQDDFDGEWILLWDDGETGKVFSSWARNVDRHRWKMVML